MTHRKPARKIRPRLFVMMACTFVLLFISMPAVVAAQSGRFTPPESSPVTEAWTRLTSESLGLAERAAAATELLEMDDKEATGALSLALTTQQSRIGWRAVIQAVATVPDNPPKELAQPLIGLLGHVDAGLADDLAAALGRFDQSDVIRQLSKIAESSREPVARRCGAILTLGHDRTTQTAGLLMKLTDAGQPEQVQQASFKALGNLTALDHYDADRQAWEDWWKQNKGLWAKDWTDHILENFERRESRRRARDHQLEDKLLESQRALYQANSPEGRPDVLVYMLADALTPIRQLGMDLTRQRLLDDLPFEEPLREALRGRLTDAVPSIRADAALRLRDLSDTPAAEAIAGRLGEEREQVSSVLGAYLQVMARLPQAEAVDPAAEFLNDAALRADAAAALAAAFDAGLMNKSQVNRAAKLARKYVVNGQPPAPQVITLMGKVGNRDDWRDIAIWVDHPDTLMKQAAARAWADSDRELNHLADRISDPVVEPILIAAATRRGDGAYTFAILTSNRPQRDRSAESWRQALVAMAARVPADAVLNTARQLSELGESSRLRLDLLSSAIDRGDTNSITQAERLELMLSRGEVLLRADDPSAALSDFQAVAVSESDLPASQKDRLGRGLISAYLLVGQIDQAFDIARELLGPAPGRAPGHGITATDDRIVDQFIQTAQRFRRENRKEEVEKITHQLRDMLKPAIKPEVGAQIDNLESWLNGSINMLPATSDAGDSDGSDSNTDEPVAE
jgi:hypothetical protein